MTTNAIEGLKNLIAKESSNMVDYDISAYDLSGLICQLLGEICLRDVDEGDKLYDWEHEINSLRCKIMGGHVWENDQCGYWGHQYCLGCRAPKYPELSKLRCSEAIAKVGRITEEEFLHETAKKANIDLPTFTDVLDSFGQPLLSDEVQ